MQLVEFPFVEKKPWDWHYTLWKEWLRTAQEGLSERKYVKWIRTRKVFERRFIRFTELMLGITREPGKPIGLDDVGDEMVEALAAKEAKLKAELEAQLAASLAAQAPRPVAGRRGAPPPVAPRPAPLPAPAAPRPAARRGDDDEDLPEGVEGGAGGPDQAAMGPPTAENDPFVKALLERLTELSGYLSMFILREMGDGFLGASEMMKRIGTSSFEGARPNVKQLDAWLIWMEWFGGVQKVGFRHKATTAGREVGAYLVELPREDLLEGPVEMLELPPEEAEEEEKPAAAPAPALRPGRRHGEAPRDDDDDEGGPAPAPAAKAEDADEDDDDDDAGQAEPEDLSDAEIEEEGLELPPQAEAPPDAERYWKTPDPVEGPRPPTRRHLQADLLGATEASTATAATAAPKSVEVARPEPVAARPAASLQTPAIAPVASAPVVSAPVVSTPVVSTPVVSTPVVSTPVASTPVASTPVASTPVASTPVVSTPVVSAPVASAPAVGAPVASAPSTTAIAQPMHSTSSSDTLRQALGWWLDGAGPAPAAGPSLVQAAGVRLAPHPSGKPVGVFKLLALAALVEVGPREAALELFKAIDASGALEAMVTDAAPLERVLEASSKAGASPALEERLVHLARYRRGLLGLKLGALNQQPDARALAKLLRDHVTGASLGPGLGLVLRELARSGQRLPGVEAIDWLPWPS